MRTGDAHCRIKRLNPQTIGVYSDRGLAAILREQCPDFFFADSGSERDGCRVSIIDGDAAVARKSMVRIILDATAGERKPGELHLKRDTFLGTPRDYLLFGCDLVQAGTHAVHLEREVGYLKQIHELMSMTDADAVSERITRNVLDLVGQPRGTLYLHDPRLERYVVSYSSDPDAPETGEFLPGIPPALLQKALSSGKSFAVDPEAGLAVMPLQVEHDLIGVIRVPITSAEAFTTPVIDDVSDYVRGVASVVGNIYQLTRSRDLAMRDDLTKAFNRRFFETYLDEEIERSRRYGSIFSIIFLDLDDLKMVNNLYGHLTGSRTLQEVAKRILSAVRAIDKVVRFGGDEFCIILPETDQEQAIAVANRVRKSLTSGSLRLDADIEISITASFGIASYPTNGLNKDDLIRAADAAMYSVKATTKNAVGIATPIGAAPESSRPVA